MASPAERAFQVTTDVGKNKCASTHGGTSAAAPNAVGIFALALSVRYVPRLLLLFDRLLTTILRPELTWRDIQHLSVRTAKVINPDDPDWDTTASGRRFSYKYGFGALSGIDFVNAAKTWQLVKPQAWVEIPPVQVANGTCDLLGTMAGGAEIVPGGLQSTIQVSKETLGQNNLEKLEHVTVRVWITHTRRGDVEVELVSPNGVKSILAARRHGDSADTGYPGWRFMSVKHWSVVSLVLYL